METRGIAFFILGVATAAFVLEVFIIWRRRQLRSQGREHAAPDAGLPRAPIWFAKGLERFGRHVVAAGSAWRRLMSLAQQELPQDDGARLRWSIVLAALFLNWSIGHAYAEAIPVHGWQLWTWAVTVAVAFLALVPWGRPPALWSRDCLIVLGLVILGGLLRIPGLDTIAPGLHTDEVGLADVTLRHVFSAPGVTLNPFRSGSSAQPTLFYYLLWSSMRLFGENMVGLRLPSALAGTLSIAATYLVTAQVSGKRVGLFSAALLLTYHYHIHWSRLALNNVWDTLWIPAILGLFAWSWRSGRSGGAALSGFALGLSQYFYLGSKLAIFLLPFLAYSLWRREPDSRKLLVHSAKVLAAAGVVALPLIAFAVREPSGLLDRLPMVFFWQSRAGFGLDPAGVGWWAAFQDQLFRTFAGFTTLTDGSGFYRPQVPLVLGLAAPLLLGGIAWATLKRQWLPVLWIGLAMLFGGFALSSTPASSHYTAAIPAIVWLIALLLDGIWTHMRPWLALVLLTAVMATDLLYYFAIYIPLLPHGDLNQPFPPGPFR